MGILRRLGLLAAGAAMAASAFTIDFYGVNWSGTGGAATTSSLYIIHSDTATITTIGDTGLTRLNSFSYDGMDRLVTISSADGKGYSLDPTTGAPTLLFDQTGMPDDDVRSLAVDETGWYVYSLASSASLYKIDPSTGIATLIGATGVIGLQGMTFDRATGILYGVNLSAGSPDKLGSLSLSTGEWTEIGGDTEIGLQSIAIDSEGRMYGGATGRLYTIDKTTGDMALLTTGLPTSFDTRGMEVVPEPTGLAALALGVAWALRRRRRAN